MSFPLSPTLNQTWTEGSVSYKWNGYAWDVDLTTGILNTIPDVTISTNGFMIAADKVKLNAITGINTGDQDLSALATTEYVIASEKTQGIFVASYTLADGTAGAATVANTVTKYPYNTVNNNSITGASMTSSVITLPAGEYVLDYVARTNSSGGMVMFMNDGTNDKCFAAHSQDSTYAVAYPLIYVGKFTLSATANIEMRFKCSTTGSLGTASGVTGYVETHGIVRFVKVA